MIYSYRGISKSELDKPRLTSDGRQYSLNHDIALVVDMKYKGKGISTSNSQGWERNSGYYFKELFSRHPEFFSKKNMNRLSKGESPIVDATIVKYFPQYRDYKNEVLIHHHIGKNGQAVAIPASMHKGSGEIHIYENQLGITENANNFSVACEKLDKSIQLKNLTADVIHNDFFGGKKFNMGKTLTLTNDYYRAPSNEELLQSGTEAIDKHMDILRDEMRNDGMSDGPEMESIISSYRENELSELRAGIYGDENANTYGGNTQVSSDEDIESAGHSTIEDQDNAFSDREDGAEMTEGTDATGEESAFADEDYENEASVANIDEKNAFSYTEEDFEAVEGIDAIGEENAFADENYENEAGVANIDEENAFSYTEEDFGAAEGIDAVGEENAFADEDYENEVDIANIDEENAFNNMEEDFEAAEEIDVAQGENAFADEDYEVDAINVDEENAFSDMEEDFKATEEIDAMQGENAFADEGYEIEENSVNIGENNALNNVEEDFQPADGLEENISTNNDIEQSIG
ncbi:hypothetical protein DXB77_07465 [Clostridium sp. OM05-9]|jgi:hypothetical protein|uniref:hypothetical protein n=1 Tax=Clostridium sp. OM05-9 TaxID=2293045 RepID=UPI000E50964F|nr:hypothetical protein [Clostridium sp. OM05-9]RHV11018.1 hypothetical protein DXB77_07465 [Clostridium sp. OM05-9]